MTASPREPSALHDHEERLLWRPTVFDRTDPEQDAAFRELVSGSGVWRVRDAIHQQLVDLVRARHPRKDDLSEAECAPHIARLLDGMPESHWGRWVHYPWSGELVHVLGPREFRELRSDRNRYKITPEEQDRLRQVTVGVVGLSVGNVIALTLAMEGAAGHLKLADLDHLELSNMNRIRASVHQLQLPKTVLAARQILEMDPYAELTVFHEGLTEDNLDGFLGGERPVDILLDECDGIAMKFRLRERARELRIPVLMETSDRGMLDVERFDLEPERPIFHGLVGDVAAHELVDIDSERKATLMLKIIGSRTTSTRAAASLMEIDRSISAWPQLASDVTLGGATATIAVRRLALGHPLASGRTYVDLEHTLVTGGDPAELPGSEPPPPLPGPGLAAPRPDIETIPEPIRFVVEHAALAPSGGNCQPWHFHWDGRALWLTHDTERSKNLLDRRRHASLMTFGMAYENLRVAAAHRNLVVHGDLLPVPDDPTVIARITLSEGGGAEAGSALFRAISERVSNRRHGVRRPLRGGETVALLEAARLRDTTLELCLHGHGLDEIGHILGAGDRIRLLCPRLHREMMGELRWTAEEAERTRDGLDLATLELTAFQRAAMGVLARTDVATEARRPGRGRALEEMSADSIASASSVGLLSFDGDSPADWLRAGRAVQRIWLTATHLGLAMQPMTALLYMFELLDDVPDLYNEGERADLQDLRVRLGQVFRGSRGRTWAFLFRLAHAPPATARSLRLPLDHVLEWGAPAGIADLPSA